MPTPARRRRTTTQLNESTKKSPKSSVKQKKMSDNWKVITEDRKQEVNITNIGKKLI